MSTSGIENIVAQALKNLSAEWQQTRAHWRDGKAVEFEKRTWNRCRTTWHGR